MRTKSKRPSPPGEGPVRTCVVTRESGPPEALVRVVLGPDGTVEVDYRARLGGRGAWLLPRRDVIATAEAKPGLLARMLHVETCNTTGLLERVRAANERTVGELLSLSARSGALASGGDQATSAVRAGDALGLVVASDAAQTSIDAVRGDRDLTIWTLPWDREALGHRIGKGPRAIVALRAAVVTRALAEQLRRMQDLR
ncbi:MAG: DUF448 domain-containing protein [Pseudomonadota bacterium]|nr:DUF448 domain-containing protein [Pseudomonadota bacterium]